MKLGDFAGFAALLLAATTASAATLYTQAAPTGPLESPGSLLVGFAGGAGAATASFSLHGYGSLDGNNAWSDVFTLSLNGTALLSGTYDLGGGGGHLTMFAPIGSSIDPVSFGPWNGGIANFVVPLTLVAGPNKLQFAYSGGAQGQGDEAWGLSNLVVTGEAPPAALPAPAMTPIFSEPGSGGMLQSPGALEFSFDAHAGQGRVTFDLNGFLSLDGNNAWSDVFTLALNGTDILSGTYDLGGGGGNLTFFAPDGSSIDAVSYGVWNGGLARFDVPLGLLEGLNTLSLRYSGSAQGLGDEGWNVSNLTVYGPSGAVPEPASWALMIAGFGLVGARMRRRRPALA
jgi:hypothetical protein